MIRKFATNHDFQIVTLSDLLYERIMDLTRLCCIDSNEPSTVSISKALFIEDEVECVSVLSGTIKDYISCLKGERSLLVRVEYHRGDISVSFN